MKSDENYQNTMSAWSVMYVSLTALTSFRLNQGKVGSVDGQIALRTKEDMQIKSIDSRSKGD